jgi:UDP-glucose 4-epimerase
MRILLLGSNGYIGKHLYKSLHGLGHYILCADIQDSPVYSMKNYVKLDISDKKALQELEINQFDFVFFFSGLTGTSIGFKMYDKYINVNEVGLLNVLDLIKDSSKKPKIIFPSTRLVYKGIADTPLNEESEIEPKTIYAVNKYSSEMLLKIYSHTFDVNYTVYRICVPYGNMLDFSFSYGTIGNFIKNASEGRDIKIFGTGEPQRTFTYIEDISTSIIKSFALPQTKNQVYNIGGETLSLLKVAELIAKKFHVKVIKEDYSDMDKKIETGDTIFNSDKLNKLINYHSTNNFENWLNNLIVN